MLPARCVLDAGSMNQISFKRSHRRCFPLERISTVDGWWTARADKRLNVVLPGKKSMCFSYCKSAWAAEWLTGVELMCDRRGDRDPSDWNDTAVVELQIIFRGCQERVRALSGCWHRLSARSKDGPWARPLMADTCLMVGDVASGLSIQATVGDFTSPCVRVCDGKTVD